MGNFNTINYIVYIHDNPTDYDEWVEEGIPDWKYKVPSHFQIRKRQISRGIKFN